MSSQSPKNPFFISPQPPAPIKQERRMAFIPTTNLPTPRRAPQPRAISQTPQAKLSRRQALLLPLLIPLPALADHTYVAAKRAYDRYHPRILSAIETLKQIRAAVLENNPTAANELITDKVFDIKARRAFSIYATSFSDNYLGERSRALLKFVDALYAELGFVAKGVDADVHYAKAVDRLGDYYREARLPVSEIAGLEI